MKPAPFKYFVPTTVDEALALLTEYGYDAKILAGGQSLVPTMNFRLAQPAVLIDINRVPDLGYVKAQNSELHIGAMTRQRELERNKEIAKRAPLVNGAMPHVAHAQIRNRGTLGGSLAHADPAAELPAVMVALGSKFLLKKQDEERWVKAKDFFVDLFTVDLEPEEIIAEIVIPGSAGNTGWAFQEVARRHGDFALCGVAASVATDENGICTDAKIVLFGVGNCPVEAGQGQRALIGKKPDPKIFAEAAALIAEKDVDPISDMHASSGFRRHLSQVLAVRTLLQAFERLQSN